MEPNIKLNFEPLEDQPNKVVRPKIVKDAEFEELSSDPTENTMFNKIKEHSEKVGGSSESNDDIPKVEAEEVHEEEEEKSALLNGKMLLFMINLAIPNIALLIYSWVPQFKKQYTFNKAALSLDDEEREMISDSSDEVARILFGNLTPMQQFFIGLGVIYAMKLPQAFQTKTDNEK